MENSPVGLSAHGFVINKESRGPRGPWVSTTPKFSVDNALVLCHGPDFGSCVAEPERQARAQAFPRLALRLGRTQNHPATVHSILFRVKTRKISRGDAERRAENESWLRRGFVREMVGSLLYSPRLRVFAWASLNLNPREFGYTPTFENSANGKPKVSATAAWVTFPP